MFGWVYRKEIEELRIEIQKKDRILLQLSKDLNNARVVSFKVKARLRNLRQECRRVKRILQENGIKEAGVRG